MSIVVAYDAIHANIKSLPGGQAAGYTTGTADIKWTGPDWAAHPGAVRICQDAAASDDTADILDVERYAATNAECAGWYKRAKASYDQAKRPGQRWPGIYTSQSNVTPLVNALIAGGVTAGPRLFIANWNLTEAQAGAVVAAASGPFPVIGLQFASLAGYDIEVYSGVWLAATSAPPPPAAGPYRHVIPAGYGRNIEHLALSRHTTVAHLVDLSMKYCNPAHQAVISGYMDLHNALKALGEPSPPLPTGLVYYTTSP